MRVNETLYLSEQKETYSAKLSLELQCMYHNEANVMVVIYSAILIPEYTEQTAEEELYSSINLLSHRSATAHGKVVYLAYSSDTNN